MYVCVIFLPVITHKLTVSSLCLCPSQLLVQQVYFPASAPLTFTMRIDLLEVTNSVFDLTAEILTAVMLLASKVHFKLVNSPGHSYVKSLPAVT